MYSVKQFYFALLFHSRNQVYLFVYGCVSFWGCLSKYSYICLYVYRYIHIYIVHSVVFFLRPVWRFSLSCTRKQSLWWTTAFVWTKNRIRVSFPLIYHHPGTANHCLNYAGSWCARCGKLPTLHTYPALYTGFTRWMEYLIQARQKKSPYYTKCSSIHWYSV
jgi:hypothetical protein